MNDRKIKTGVRLTPALAQAWLDTRKRQRPCNALTVADYAAKMTRGEWGIGDSLIVFDEAGALVNGQTRCSAVVKSQETIVVDVGHNWPSDSFLYMDTGRRRSAADTIAIEGGANHYLAAATLACVVAVEEERATVTGWKRLSNADVRRHYQRLRSEIDDAISSVGRLPLALGIPSGVACGAFVLFARVERDAALDFVRTLRTGEAPVMPTAFTLREALLRRGKGRRSEGENLAVLIKAWNAREEVAIEHIRRRTAPTYVRQGTAMPAVLDKGGAIAGVKLAALVDTKRRP